MQAAEFLRTLWAGRWIIVATVIIATVTTYFVADNSPKVYEASSTLFVGDKGQSLDDFSALQSAQSLTKTYAELIQSENIADRVAGELPGDQTGGELLDKLSFRPITETQLIVVTAEAGSARGAAVLANRYAERFIDYARTNLSTRTSSEISLVDAAQPPLGPVRPRPLLYSAIMLFVSVFIGIGLALLRAQFDRSLGDDEELGRTLDAPVLTRVPSISSRKLAGAREDQFLEAFRILRANISFLSPSAPVRSVLITSAEPGEGKTTVSVALARVLGEQGQRVLLIEGDLRRPALSQALDLRGEQWQGLAQYLAGQNLSLPEVAHSTTIDNVWLIPAGAMAPAPSVLLQPETLQKLMTQALEWADFVIVDSPPLSAGADSPILANTVGNVLVVANAQRSRRPKVIAAIRALRQAGAHVAGLIVNGVQDGGSYSYYDYGDQPRRDRNKIAEELATPVER
jgi:receptor protein-tyrosine kinase